MRSLFRTLYNTSTYYLCGSALVIIAVLGLFHYWNSQVYVVSVDQLEVGVVEDAREVEGLIEDLIEEYSDFYGMDLEFAAEVSLIKDRRPNCEPEPEAVQERIREQASFMTEALMITVDGKPFVPVACEEDLDQVLESLKEEYTAATGGDSTKIIEFSVLEDLALEEIIVDPDYVFTPSEVFPLLKAGGDDNLLMADASSARKTQDFMHHPTITEYEYNLISPPENSAATGLNPEREKPGVGEVTVSVKVVEEVTEVESIPFSTEYDYDDNLLISEIEVKEPGREGQKEIIYQVERKNGVEVDRKVIREEVIQEPEPRVEIKGRKELPSTGSGRFIWPVRGKGTVYNGFSSRHTGIDIHIDHGTYVLAAADGVVTYDGYGNTQGKYLIIQHGEYWTLYLHNSEHLVSKGARVSRGQPIARVGATGRAFGPHLHFEVRIDDGSREWNSYYQHRPVDPQQFFNR